MGRPNPNISANSWHIFNSWHYKRSGRKIKMNWACFDALIPYHNAIIEKQYQQLIPLLEQWNVALKGIAKEPTYKNWNKFRPLRLSREEDWADWLAHLIETATTGSFAHHLLQTESIKGYKPPKDVLREDIHKNYRADLIIAWENSKYTHMEVKIGDPNLKKTYPTSEAFRKKFKAKKSDWRNFILLLSSQLPEWEHVVENTDSETIIHAVTWEDVCISLRRALLSDEAIIWKVWAITFLGAVEQILIGYPGYLLGHNVKPKENVDKKILILKKSLGHE